MMHVFTTYSISFGALKIAPGMSNLFCTFADFEQNNKVVSVIASTKIAEKQQIFLCNYVRNYSLFICALAGGL